MHWCSNDIIQEAIRCGFDDCAVVNVCRLDDDAAFMDDWVNAGLNGNMAYLERNRERRYNPGVLVPGARTMLITLLKYANCGHDYHRTVKSGLYQLEKSLTETFGKEIVSEEHQHIFCDSAPMLERRWAQRAGLGFIGKNHQLIHPKLGSMVHIGELILNREIEITQHETIRSQCGDCTKCIEACPGQALGQNEWDARKCTAYVTHKCLICQQKCPYNEGLF